MKQSAWPATVVLLCLTAFLAPFCGGNLNFEASHLEPGVLAFLTSAFAGSDTPGASNLLVVFGAFACAMVLVLKRRVLQLPSGQVSIALLAFIGLLTVSVIVSPYKSISVAAWAQWIAYCIVFFAAASGAGRVRGPKMILATLAGGCVWIALRGILEWQAQRSIDPTWRIFGGWQNPNALAGMLVLGLIVSIALCITSERLGALLFGLGGAVIALALYMTQSRGGMLAGLVGVGLLLVGVAFQSDKAARRSVVKAFASIGFAVILVAAFVASNRAGPSRLVSSSSATEQSTGFRKLLWRGAAMTMVAHATGTGLGTYANVSAESGLNEETKLTHNTLLQLGVEATVLAPVALLALFGIWGFAVLRGKQPQRQSGTLRIGIVCAVAASLVDGLFESNLYYFGTGVAVFLLLGLGLQAATDAVAPEFSPPSVRRSFGFGVIVIAVMLTFTAYREAIKGHVRYDRVARDSESLVADLAALRPIADGDGEAHYLQSFSPSQPESERLAQLREAAGLEPTLKHFNTLAQAEALAGNTAAAEAAFQNALKLDPNNLEVLSRMLAFYQKLGNTTKAVETAKRMVEIDDKPYMKIRALSELVPLETADARVYLASQSTDRNQTAAYLGDATQIYVHYAKSTVPYLRHIWDRIQGLGVPMAIANETEPGTLDKLLHGVEIAKSAVVGYRAAGRPDDAAKAAASEAELEGVLADCTAAFGNK